VLWLLSVCVPGLFALFVPDAAVVAG